MMMMKGSDVNFMVMNVNEWVRGSAMYGWGLGRFDYAWLGLDDGV